MAPTLDIPAELKSMTEDPQYTETKRVVARTRSIPEVRDAGPQNLYQSVLSLYAEGMRNTPAQVEILSGFEEALDVFRATGLGMRKSMDVRSLELRLGARDRFAQNGAKSAPATGSQAGDDAENDPLRREVADARMYSNRAALAFAGHVGLAKLGAAPGDTTNLESFGPEAETAVDNAVLVSHLAKKATSDVDRLARPLDAGLRTDDHLRSVFQQIYTTWINQFNWNTWKDVAAKRGVEDLVLAQGEYSFQKGQFSRKHTSVIVEPKFMDVKKDDVIGTPELSTVLWNGFMRLAQYDHETKRNDFKPYKCVFTWGAPGEGKTFVAHANIQSFADYCRDNGVPAWFISHSVSDYASEYQNKTANMLAELGGQINAFPGIVVMYVADADIIFMTRGDNKMSQEQKQTQGVYMKMFDGTMIRKNGKFMAVMDANYIAGIDPATQSRIFDKRVEFTRFKRPEDFAEMCKRTLTKGGWEIPMKDDDYLAVGQYIIAQPTLSNRKVDHVLGQVYEDLTVPEDLVRKSKEEKRAFLREYASTITRERLMGKFESYIALEKNFEDISRQEQLEQMFGKWGVNLQQEYDPTRSQGETK